MKEINFDENIAREIAEGDRAGSIRTRFGDSVKLVYFGAKGNYPVVGLVDLGDEEVSKQWTSDGRIDMRPNVTSCYDLVIETETEGGGEA